MCSACLWDRRGSPEGGSWCWSSGGDVPAGALMQAGTRQCVRGTTRSAGAWMHQLRPHDLHRREVTETTQPPQSAKQGKAGSDTRPVPHPQAFPYFRTFQSLTAGHPLGTARTTRCRHRAAWLGRVSWQEPQGCRMLGADSPWPAQAPQRPPASPAGMTLCTCGARIRSYSRKISRTSFTG